MKHFSRGLCGLLLVVTVAMLVRPQNVAAATTATTGTPSTGTSSTSTADGFNIITSPLPIKLSTAPGRTVSADLRMKNQGNAPETIQVGLMKFAANGNTGQPNLADLTPKDTYAKWVHFSPAQFVAEPNVWKTVHMTIDVPSDAALDYYLAVTFSRANQHAAKNAENFKGAVATLVLLNVNSPNTKRDLELSDFSTTHGLYEYLPATFTVKLRNKGNVYLSAAGTIFIQRGDKPISTIQFNQAGGSVLPGSDRVFSVPWSSGFPAYKDKVKNGVPVAGKDGKPQQSLKWDFSQLSKFRIGKYTAKLLISYDNGKEDIPLEATVSFWVLPWKLLLLLIVVLAAIGFGIWTALRSVFRGAKGGVKKIRKNDTE